MRLAIDHELGLDAEATHRLEDRIGVVFGRFGPLVRSLRVSIARLEGDEARLRATLQRADGTQLCVETPAKDLELGTLEHLVDRAARSLQRELRQRINH